MSGVLTTAELASIRREYRGASLLPARMYQDQAILDWERQHILLTDWLMVARVEDVAEPGSFQLDRRRGRERHPRPRPGRCRSARSTTCAATGARRSRSASAARPSASSARTTPGSTTSTARLIRAKHTEDLEEFSFDTFGLREIHSATWQGFVFLNLSEGPVAPLEDQLGDLVPHMERFEFDRLRVAKRIEYEVGANWKFIAENYSECYHCPGVHPQLNKLTPYDLGGDFEPDGAWQGGWMELVDGAETMALDGGHGSKHGRPAMCGITTEDEARVYYYVLWPLTFLSIHPDYLLVHRLVPRDAGHTLVICDWLFEADTIAQPDFDPSEPIAFWDLTNQQDWHVCELQQRGTSSRSWVAGRYSNNEASVHAFDQMLADRYAGDGVESHRTVRDRYDTPPPKVEPGHHHTDGADADGHHPEKDRHAARAKAAGRT